MSFGDCPALSSFDVGTNASNITAIYLRNCKNFSSFDFSSFSSLSSLTISDCKVGSTLALPTTSNPLTGLILNDDEIKNISFLENIKTLTTLDLSGNSISDLTPLLKTKNTSGNVTYTRLNLSGNPIGGDLSSTNVDVLLQLKSANLGEITVTGCGFGTDSIKALAEGNLTYTTGFEYDNVKL